MGSNLNMSLDFLTDSCCETLFFARFALELIVHFRNFAFEHVSKSAFIIIIIIIIIIVY